jgi:hypothetical protein
MSTGHNRAYLFRSASGKIELLGSDDFPLGVFDVASHESSTLLLWNGDVLIVFDSLPT